MATSAGGKRAIYQPKDGDKSYKALSLTAKGQQLFEKRRAALGKRHKWPRSVSDADVIDDLVRNQK